MTPSAPPDLEFFALGIGRRLGANENEVEYMLTDCEDLLILTTEQRFALL